MLKYALKIGMLSLMFSLASVASKAQKVKEPKNISPEWSRSYAPFRIAGNLYYVGTYDLACYLVTTPKGHILINTGLAASAKMIKASIESLGFKFNDVKILLTTQAHYDHMGAMAAIKKMTGASMMVDYKDAAVMSDGGSSDYALGGYGRTYAPVQPDRLLHDGDSVRLGDMKLVMLHHPGHTKGSCSFLFDVKDEQRTYRVLIANMPSIVTEKKFAELTAYPEIAQDYAYTLKAMKNLSFDLWLSSHASQFGLHQKRQAGLAYNPAAFMERAGYDAALSDFQRQYYKKITEN
jgi:metallo-beta-lactamase class B